MFISTSFNCCRRYFSCCWFGTTRR